MRVVCISDTHMSHRDVSLPEGDVLVHAGDFLNYGYLHELPEFVDWSRTIRSRYRHMVCTPGNHDWAFDPAGVSRYGPRRVDPALARYLLEEAGWTVLIDEAAKIEGHRVYGSPWQPEFCNWAFNLPRHGYELRARWAAIPDDVQILITHGPPHGQGDRLDRGDRVGCELLAERVQELTNLRLHVFGHVHSGYGVQAPPQGASGPAFVNASICTETYTPDNAPIVIDL